MSNAEPITDAVARWNGVLGCGDCRALQCVQVRNTRGNQVGLISDVLGTTPAVDVSRVVCAGCSKTLWLRGDGGE